MNLSKRAKYIFVIVFYVACIVFCEESSNVNNTSVELEIQSNVLSRRKRFIIFPEGSSIQLVFCNTFPMIFAIGDIFLYGYTAALAWELPQDPYSPFMHHADPLHRRVDTKTLYYINEDGKILFKKPYKKKIIVNPAMAKRSIDAVYMNAAEFKKGTEFEIDRKRMHASQHKREFLKSEHIDEHSVEFHRSSRASLYEKMESLFKALGVNGRQCLLKTLCLVGQTRHQQQTPFLQEILRAVFTLPEGKSFDKEHHMEYDTAHLTTGSCDDLYPECIDSVPDPTTPLFSY